jgi:hypothetical protein
VTTGKSPLDTVLNAVFDALNVAAFTALSTGGLYNDVPQGVSYPLSWVTPGNPAEEPADTFGKIGAVCRVELHVYSQYEGDTEATDLVNKAHELLHHVALSLTGYACLNVVRDPVQWSVEDHNGVATRHAVAPYLIQVLES